MSAAPDWRERLGRRSLGRIALGLAVGVAGGFVADLAGVPLAWMLGALFACMAAGLAGAPVDVPVWVRTAFLALIGLFLGEAFSRTPVERFADWPVSILASMALPPVAAIVGYQFYRRVARLDRASALLSAIPGGLTGVVMISAELGADERRVALSQSIRVATVVVAAPVVAFGLLGLPPPAAQAAAAGGGIGGAEAALLIPAAALAIWLLWRLGAPVPFLVGALLASAALRLGGLIEGAMPVWLVDVALVVTGASIGSRFRGMPLRELGALAAWTVCGTAVLMVVSALFAVAIWATQDVGLFAALLAYAPGGVAEMSFIAIAIDADPAFVAAHHMARILFILLAMPLIGGWLRRFFARG